MSNFKACLALTVVSVLTYFHIIHFNIILASAVQLSSEWQDSPSQVYATNSLPSSAESCQDANSLHALMAVSCRSQGSATSRQ